MGDEVQVPRIDGGSGPLGKGADPADVSGAGCSDRKGARQQGSCTRVGIESSDRQSIGSNLMKRIKGRSSRKLQQEFSHLRRRYWGRHFWARGYFCATSGRVTDDQIKDYIEGHDEEPPDPEFTIDS